MYILFKLTKDNFAPFYPVDRTESIVKERVTALNSGIVNAMYWNLISCGKCRVYIVRKGGKIIHTSYVIPKCPKFPFLNKQDVEIGPCRTVADERGKGIFPCVLSKILCEYLEHGAAYIFADAENLASLKSIEKVGFLSVGQVRKDGLKRYVAA